MVTVATHGVALWTSGDAFQRVATADCRSQASSTASGRAGRAGRKMARALRDFFRRHRFAATAVTVSQSEIPD